MTESGAITEGSRRGRPPGTTAEETRSRLVTAARTSFATQGYAGTSLKRVAADVGVTPPAVYNHFGSKEDLFVACAVDTYRRAREAVQDAIAGSGRFSERLVGVLEGLGELYRADPAVPGFLGYAETAATRYTTGERTRRIRDAQGEVKGLLSEMLDAGVAAGEVAAARDDMASLLRLLILGFTFYVSAEGANAEGALRAIHALLQEPVNE